MDNIGFLDCRHENGDAIVGFVSSFRLPLQLQAYILLLHPTSSSTSFLRTHPLAVASLGFAFQARPATTRTTTADVNGALQGADLTPSPSASAARSSRPSAFAPLCPHHPAHPPWSGHRHVLHHGRGASGESPWNARCDAARSDLAYTRPERLQPAQQSPDINDQGTWRKLCGLPWPSAIPASSKGVLSSGAQFCRHTVVKRGAALKPGRTAKRDTLKLGLVIRRRALLSRKPPPSGVQPAALVHPPLAKLFGLPWPSAIPAFSKGVLSSGAQFRRHTVVKRGAALKPGRKAKRDTLKLGLVIRRRALLSRKSPPSGVQPAALVHPPLAYAPPAPVPVPVLAPSFPLQNITMAVVNSSAGIKKGTKKKRGRTTSIPDSEGGDGKRAGKRAVSVVDQEEGKKYSVVTNPA
ncbi:hypothetical protein B0H17DRAFT_1333398 [Mycena rosella]|uniref:Uncharacterized protein n=1 Tax=Mycena rosella TaxID=1033263 RepID=A0AAD7D7Q2_MYCRO|nr:hypothetical protein B0H17DRAFT_1333398 [Mycena rosella]